MLIKNYIDTNRTFNYPIYIYYECDSGMQTYLQHENVLVPGVGINSRPEDPRTHWTSQLVLGTSTSSLA